MVTKIGKMIDKAYDRANTNIYKYLIEKGVDDQIAEDCQEMLRDKVHDVIMKLFKDYDEIKDEVSEKMYRASSKIEDYAKKEIYKIFGD